MCWSKRELWSVRFHFFKQIENLCLPWMPCIKYRNKSENISNWWSLWRVINNFQFFVFVEIVVLTCIFVQKIMKMLIFSYLFDQIFRITNTNRLFNHAENTSPTKPHLPQPSTDLGDYTFGELNDANIMKMMRFSENVMLLWKCLVAQTQGILNQNQTKTQNL